MAFRKRRHESEGDSDDGNLPINNDDDDDGLVAEPAKKARNIWSDMLMEEQLLEKGQKIDLDKSAKKQPNIARGPESYVMPHSEFQRKQCKSKKKTEDFEKPIVMVTPASDDPFGDAPGALAEEFGVKKNEVKLPEEPEEGSDGWWGAKGANKKYLEKGTFEREKKAPVVKKTSQLMAAEFSLESMIAATFDEGIALDQLANEIATAMGEKDPETITKIVNAIGRDVALKLFNETKEVEQNGGMKTADGSRRRTPGGVFITLFKMDPNVTREMKNGIFGDMRTADKQRSKKKRRGLNYEKKLEDMKKTMELAEQAQNDLANEELAQPAHPFTDEVVDMV